MLLEILLVAIFVVMVIAVIALWDSNDRLRFLLKNAIDDIEMWKRRAIEGGWKNPYENIRDMLTRTESVLGEIGETMRRTNAMQKESIEKLRRINADFPAVNEQLRASLVRLDAVALPLRPPVQPQPPARLPDDVSIILEPDPRKRN